MPCPRRELTVTVPRKPTRAGIDPTNLLIDMKTDDNIKTSFRKEAGKAAVERGSVPSPSSRRTGSAQDSVPASGLRLRDACPPDGDKRAQPCQLRLQRTPAERRRLPVLAPFVRFGFGRVGGADQIQITETLKRPIKRGDFESRPAIGSLLGLLKDRVAVTRPIHHTQQDVEFDASKRDVRIG
jgi:hypothetical protein